MGAAPLGIFIPEGYQLVGDWIGKHNEPRRGSSQAGSTPRVSCERVIGIERAPYRIGHEMVAVTRLESLPGFVSRSALTPGGASQARLTRGY